MHGQRPRRTCASAVVTALAISSSISLTACESTPILLYHGVGEPFPGDRWVSVESFREQMQLVDDEGYSPITASELDAIEHGDSPSPSKPIVITFDDGLRSFLLHAHPILREHGFRVTMFLPSDWIAEDDVMRRRIGADYLIWPEVQALESDGVEHQAHSRTHPRLRDLSVRGVEDEVAGSKRILEERLGHEVSVFAYPGGSLDPSIERIVEDSGYASAHSVSAGLNGRYERQRISIRADVDLETFRGMLRGTWWGSSNGSR